MTPRPFRPILYCFVLALAFLTPDRPLYAQDTELIELRKKVADLDLKIKQLETQLRDCNDAIKMQATGKPGWHNKKNWRKLKQGMDEGQVRTILGEPTKVIQGVKTLWYYPNLYSSYVSFDDKGRVAGWSEPTPASP